MVQVKGTCSGPVNSVATVQVYVTQVGPQGSAIAPESVPSGIDDRPLGGPWWF